MSQGEAFIAFYTLLLGLGIAALLTGFADVLRRHRLREVGAVGALLSSLIIFEFLTGWSGATRAFANSEAKVLSLLAPFGTGACYFLASVLMFPVPGEIGERSFRDYVGGQVRTIALLLFTANSLLVLAEIPSTMSRSAIDPPYFWWFYLPYNTAILGCYAVMIAAPRRRIAIAAMVALLAIYAWITGAGRV